MKLNEIQPSTADRCVTPPWWGSYRGLWFVGSEKVAQAMSSALLGTLKEFAGRLRGSSGVYLKDILKDVLEMIKRTERLATDRFGGMAKRMRARLDKRIDAERRAEAAERDRLDSIQALVESDDDEGFVVCQVFTPFDGSLNWALR